MKNKQFTEAWENIIPGEGTDERIISKIEEKLKVTVKKPVLKIKPVLITALILVLLVPAVLASAPAIIKIIGGDIAFFDTDKQTRYSADQEIIKKYSSKVGVTAEENGCSLTVDNIAFDGTFFSIFYTIKKEADIVEETMAKVEKWDRKLIKSDSMIIQNAMVLNSVSLHIQDIELVHDPYIYVMNDGYLVSNHELRSVIRFIITDDLPEVFDVKIEYYNQANDVDSATVLSIPLTVDRSESIINAMKSKNPVSASVTQRRVFSDTVMSEEEKRIYAGDIGEGDEVTIQKAEPDGRLPGNVTHNITIEKVNISPLGNIIVMSEEGIDNPVNKELFSQYYITDNKGNFYGKLSNEMNHRKEYKEDKTVMTEFLGSVPVDTEYLKLIPYNENRIITENGISISYASPDSLPVLLPYSEYGSISLEECVVIGNDVTIKYKTEGFVGSIFFSLCDENKKSLHGYSWNLPVYDRSTATYTLTYRFGDSSGNVKDMLKYIALYGMSVELLDDQAVIIPLE